MSVRTGDLSGVDLCSVRPQLGERLLDPRRKEDGIARRGDGKSRRPSRSQRCVSGGNAVCRRRAGSPSAWLGGGWIGSLRIIRHGRIAWSRRIGAGQCHEDKSYGEGQADDRICFEPAIEHALVLRGYLVALRNVALSHEVTPSDQRLNWMTKSTSVIGGGCVSSFTDVACDGRARPGFPHCAGRAWEAAHRSAVRRGRR